jgi:hypothetical protein
LEAKEYLQKLVSRAITDAQSGSAKWHLDQAQRGLAKHLLSIALKEEEGTFVLHRDAALKGVLPEIRRR